MRRKNITKFTVFSQPRHWRCIFLSMGETLAPPTDFTIEQLLTYDLQMHEQTISTIHSAALAEFLVEKKLTTIESDWSKVNLKIGKHIPNSFLHKGTFIRCLLLFH